MMNVAPTRIFEELSIAAILPCLCGSRQESCQEAVNNGGIEEALMRSELREEHDDGWRDD